MKAIMLAAPNKWNSQCYWSGLVGRHCIAVDPYYLVYEAKKLGYPPQVILAGRAVNDYMSKHISESTIKAVNDGG